MLQVNIFSQVSFNLLVLVWMGIGLLIFPLLLKVTAPYGRHAKTSWGLMINNRMAWIIMELPSLVLMLYFVLMSNKLSNLLVLTAGLLWVLHYIHRAVIFPLRIHTKGKKMPILIMLFAFIFNLVNGSINGYWLANYAPEQRLSGSALLFYLLGLALFITGFIINQYHDRILIRLRKSSVNAYQIPHGGLFKYVSCPNFLGEIIEWAGFALLCRSLPSLAFLIWTMVNLVPRALDHHQWYRKHFADYPQQRKAILPKLL